MPVVLVCTEAFLPLARAVARQEGFDALPVVSIPHPIGGVEAGALNDAVLAAVDGIAERLLVTPAAEEEAGPNEVMRDAPSDVSGFLAFAMDQGWGDGLPLVPPAVELVEAGVAATGLDAETSLGSVPPSNRGATVHAIVANAVMAGCSPQVMPVVMAAVRGALQPPMNMQALTTTTHPVTPLVIVHGPMVDELGFNAGPSTFGQGNRANATVGRALRLILHNVGGAKPGETDRATHGSPTKYSYCIAENAAESPWESFHAHRGCGDARGAVTLVGGEGPHNINDHGSTDADGLLHTIAGTIGQLGHNNLYLRGQMLLVISPEHAAVIARDGYDRRGVQEAIRDRARTSVAGVSAGNLERFARISPQLFDPPPEDGVIPLLDSADDLLVLVAGGPGKHSVFVPTFGSTEAVTVPVLTP
ncbi:MAG: hypothetical protein GEU81_16175 [Nitriliruptorales bacterium]|nr:hypothetical protein [Nitriliruptorales bacterium]